MIRPNMENLDSFAFLSGEGQQKYFMQSTALIHYSTCGVAAGEQGPEKQNLPIAVANEDSRQDNSPSFQF